MKHSIWLIIVVIFNLNIAKAQQSPLDAYIDEALNSNVALKQQELSYAKSLAALEEAKAYFLPTLSFDSRFTLAHGGRTIDIPLGDLMNPVYDNLDLINSINRDAIPGYPDLPGYPRLENEEIKFVRNTDQETRFRVAVPIYNAAILNNQKIKKGMVAAESISVDIYRRELEKEVKIGYYNYLKATEAAKVFENAKKLVDENLRTTQALYDNHQITIDRVYAAEAQVKEVEQQLAIADKDEKVAQAYFNFLLNADFDRPITTIEEEALPINALSLESARNKAIQNRQELDQLNKFIDVSSQNIQLNRGNNLPEISFAADYGFQGSSYNFNRDSDFMMGSIAMKWNIFDRSNKYKVQQAQIEKSILEQRKIETSQQIGLQVVNSFYDLEAALKSIELATKEVESTRKAYKLVFTKYQRSLANLVELTESRTHKTNAEHKLVIARFDYLTKLAEFESNLGY
ncbi:MAG: TolC family protein [Bacteroidota bacterium]